MNFKRFHESKNLLDLTALINAPSGTFTTQDGTKTFTADHLLEIQLKPNTYYKMSSNYVKTGTKLNIIYLQYVDSSKATTSTVSPSCKTNNTGVVKIAMYTSRDGADDFISGLAWVMLNEGDTALPYEPYSSEVWHDITHYIHNTSTDTLTSFPAVLYPNDTTATVGLKGSMSQSSTPTPTNPIQPSECGDLETAGEHTGQYKIPISSGDTTTPIYLGEVETTRKVKKLALTGQEAFTKNNGQTNNYLYYANRGTIISGSINKTPVLCNELPVKNDAPQTEIGINTNNTFSVVYFNFGADVMNVQPSGNTVDGLKEYLAARYAAGTPVTIWYVLATETTGIVNEPLRKIGDYADFVSGITIPTTAGANTLSIGTTLQPSEVTVNYKGWHPVADVHERESGAWT